MNDSPLYANAGPLDYLVAYLPLVAILFVLVAFAVSFTAKTTKARRSWRVAGGAVLLLLVASCGILASALRLGG